MIQVRLTKLLCAMAWFFVAASTNAATSPIVKTEITALMTTLANSQCQFNRNGTWYSGAEAKTHLLRKLEYFEDKGGVKSTEQFIELAASKSSMTGQAYRVQCGKTPAVTSQVWLTDRLKDIRKAATPQASSN